MNRTLIPLLLFLASVVQLTSCRSNQPVPPEPDIARADSLMEAAHQAHDSERIIALADSLEAAGAYSAIKADYWRGYGYYNVWDNLKCQHYWYEAITLEIKDREDLLYYGRSSNRLSDVLLAKGEYEAVLRVALPALEKLQAEGLSDSRDYGYLLVTVGCCELNDRNKAAAEAHFEEAYRTFLRIHDSCGENDRAKHQDILKTAVAALTTITRHCLDKKYYSDALFWAGRLEKVLEEYRTQPETLPESVDRRLALARLYTAAALEGMGNREEAASVYEEALKSDYCSTPQGKVEAARYLMLAWRWADAADNYRFLDGVAAITGAGLTLDNIQLYLLPKYRASFYARRNDEALATGIKLCEALDSAIVWNRKDKAAELATVYHTQEIKDQFTEQQTNYARLRFLSSMAVIAILLIGFLVFIILRYRSSMRLEEAYMELEAAKARAEEASQVKSAFLMQISHEVGTPLHLISGFAQVLTTPGMELDDASKEEINAGIISNTGRITSLVSKMLELSKLMSKSQLERNDRVTPRSIAEDAISTSDIASAPGIDFEIRGSGEMDFSEFVTNRRAAGHVLALLLENAVKFTEKGSVCLRIVVKHRFVYFFVEDTGIGVPAEEAEHIFEQFVQLDDFREGTGIGLTVARSLARRLGGDVILDTSYTFGARFVFSLPLKNAE